MHIGLREIYTQLNCCSLCYCVLLYTC